MPQVVRVSVVVPVFNPGSTIDELVRSLDRQTLPPEEFEVLLCDDGSDEPTGAQLDRIAADRSNVRVLHLPHSGWPGTPRNSGVDAASGTYVYFVDQDDRLFDRALERLCEYADENGSDVVVGKEIGIGRRLPRGIFRRDIPRAKLGKDPLLEMLTPHKLFRTAFLREHGIRFPQGRVRLEDHLFVMQAYFAADTISVLASEPCYGWVKQPGSASSSRIDPDTYFPHLEAVLDLVEANAEPGALRDRLLRHWYRGKILKRLSGRQLLRYPQPYREHLLDVVRPIALRRFGPGVDAGLAFPHRVRSALLRADRRDDLVRLAEFEKALTARAQITAAAWSRGGGLRLTVRSSIDVPGGGDGDASGASGGWLLPSALQDLPPDVLRGGRRTPVTRFEVHARDDAAQLERRVAETRDALGVLHLAIDPLKVFDRSTSSRSARLTATVRHGGWSFDVPLAATTTVLAAAGSSPLLAGRRVTLVSAEDGAVELQREWPGGALKDRAARGVRRIRRALRHARQRVGSRGE